MLFALGVGKIIITLRCSLPMTRVASAFVTVNKIGLYFHMSLTVLLYTAISAAVIWAVMYFGNSNICIGFWCGFFMGIVMSYEDMGMSATNIKKYFHSFGRYYNQDELAVFLKMNGWNEAQK